METNSARIYRLKDGALAWTQVGDEAIVLEKGGHEYLRLNETATALLQALVAGSDFSELIGVLTAEYEEESTESIQNEVSQFLVMVEQRNWLES